MNNIICYSLTHSVGYSNAKVLSVLDFMADILWIINNNMKDFLNIWYQNTFIKYKKILHILLTDDNDVVC